VRILAAIALLAGCSQAPAPPDWASLGRAADGTAYFVDRSSVHRPGAYTRVTVRTQPVAEPGATTTFWVACDEGRLAPQFIQSAGASRGFGVPEDALQFEQPAAGTIGHAILREACQATYATR